MNSGQEATIRDISTIKPLTIGVLSMREQSTNKRKTYNVLPGTSMGILTLDYLERLTKIARENDISFFKIWCNGVFTFFWFLKGVRPC